MFNTGLNRASAYSRVSIETGVTNADPHQLILMLFDGALLAISSATAGMETGDIPSKGNHISKAIEIVTNGLKVSLDLEVGGDLAARLAALYDYMAERLVFANRHNSRPALDEVAGLLRDLRDAWQQIKVPQSETA